MVGVGAGGGASQRILDSNQLHQEGRKIFQYIATGVAGLSAVQSGMSLGWTSPIIPFLISKDSFLPINEDEISWISSLLAMGAIIGAVPSGKIADRIGRKRALALTMIPFFTSWIMLLFANEITMMYVARLLGGVGSGAACVLAPVYIGEIAEPSVRGALGAGFQFLYSLGIVYSYVIGAYTSYFAFNLSCAILALPLLALMPFLMESPMWLIHRGLKAEATKALEVLRGRDYNSKLELSILQTEADELQNKKGGFQDLIGTKAGRKATLTCLGLMFFMQMSGIDAVLFYTVSIFQSADSTIEPFVATIIIGLVEVAMAIVAAMTIDRYGRKPLLVGSGAMMAICLSIVGFYFKLKAEGNDLAAFGWLPLVCLALYNIVFSLGYGPVPYTMISELFPPETKGVATSLGVVMNWGMVFLVTKFFPIIKLWFGPAMTFWIFGIFMILGTAFAYFVVPETKGKTLQGIQEKLSRRKGETSEKMIDPV